MLSPAAKSHLYAIATISVWGFPYAFLKIVMAEGTFGPAELGFLRNTVAALFFIPLLIYKGNPLPAKKDLPGLFLAGLLGFSLYMPVFNYGLSKISGATSSVLISLTPLVCAVLSSIILREKLPLLAWLAMAMAFSGTAVLSLWGGSFTANSGILWTLFATFLFACYTLIIRYFSRRTNGRHYSSLQLSAYSFITSTILSLFLLPSAAKQAANAPVEHILIVVFLGLVSSALAFIFWTKALELAQNTSTVTNYMFAVPVAAFIVCYLVLGEMPNTGTFIGSIIIIAGLMLFSWSLNAALRAHKKNIS